MNNDWFFEKFALIADAPGAVATMRGLILQLAVHGKLVPQDPSDEPAEKLCEPDEELSSGSPSEVPLGWILARLEQLAEINGGFAFKSTDYTEEGARVVRISDFDEFGFKDHKVVRHSFSAEFHKFILEEQNILMAMTGGTVGKSYFVRFMPEVMVVNQRVATIKVLDSAMPRYIDIVIRSEMTQEVIRRAKNSTNDNISMGDIKGFTIPLPPLAEQKRIVAKVDELMGLCDALESQQQERELRKSVLVRSSLSRFAVAPTPENLGYLFHKSYDIPPSELRKSILTLAVQGKLVEQDINDESVKDLLLRNDARRREIARNDHRANEDNQLLLSADDRWEVTDTWSWQGLADLVLFVDYRGKTPVKMSDGIRLLTAKNVRKGHINLSPEEFLSESEYRDWMTRGFPKVGDVLFTTEAPMGNAAVVKLSERFALAQRIICFQSYGAIDPAFLVLQINSDQFQSILNTNGTGVTAKGIKASKLKQLPIAVPPLAEQHRIVAKVDQLMSLVDELERQQEASLENASKLLDAIVQKMTSGG